MTSSTSPNIRSDQDQPATLSAAAQACLKCIAGHMIPASPQFDVPGADDAAILADMVGSLRRDAARLKRLLETVDEAAGGSLVDRSAAEQSRLLVRLRRLDPAGFTVVEAVIARAYYRDDRVLRSIGMEARPPYPKGYALPETDWSLLEPVRARGFIGRPVD